MGQQNDPQPMGQLRSAAALWRSFWSVCVVCVCAPARARGNSVENQKARLIVKGSVELSHLKAQFVPQLRIFHVFVPRSVNNFRLEQFWTHETTFFTAAPGSTDVTVPLSPGC